MNRTQEEQRAFTTISAWINAVQHHAGKRPFTDREVYELSVVLSREMITLFRGEVELVYTAEMWEAWDRAHVWLQTLIPMQINYAEGSLFSSAMDLASDVIEQEDLLKYFTCYPPQRSTNNE